MDPSAVAIVFPGQGAQRPGMARDFCQRSAAAREVFAEASAAAGFDLEQLCSGSDSRLDATEFTQPAILTAEIAMVRSLDADFGLRGQYFGGHSLGEYTALVASGAMPLADAVRATRQRGALMQAAVPLGRGAMVAIVADRVIDRDLAADLEGIDVAVANRNSSNQVVLSGSVEAIALASERLEQVLASVGHRILPLNVSAPFHSPLMKGIELQFRNVLDELTPRLVPERAAVVTSNFTGRFHEPRATAMVEALTRQIGGTVDWIGNMQALCGVSERIYEVGPSRPLRSFFKSIGQEVKAITSWEHAESGLG